MYNITFQQIDTFLYIAQYLNLSKASEAMFISQPALSKTLQRFEEGIGLRLFTRGNKGVALTPEGEFLFSKLEPLYEALNLMIDEAHLISDMPVKSIRIVEPSTYDLSGNYDKIKKLIREFGKDNPDIFIAEALQDFKELRQTIEFGSADFFVTQDFILDGLTNISYKRVEEFKMYAMMSSEHPLAKNETLDFARLEDTVVCRVATIGDQYDMQITTKLCEKLGFTPKKIEFVSNFHTLFHTIQENKGISLCSRFHYIQSDIEFRYYPLPEDVPKKHVVVAWHTDRVTPEMQDFIQSIPGEAIRYEPSSETI
jgi:DNA-binding transcriptional LysR family regulator